MLRYRALWIDDSRTSAEVKAEAIREYLEDEGFVFHADIRENGDDLEELLQRGELDIVITDFNLRGIEARVLIETVRAHHKYMEVVLYSENPPPEFEQVRRSFHGIYGCTRSDVEDTIRSVIGNTIRRTQSVDNMRGIVIAEGIDIENQINEIIVTFFADKGDLAQKVLEKEGVCDFGKKIQFLHSIMKWIRRDINAVCQSSTDAATKKKATEQLQQLEILYFIAKQLPDHVMKPRNVLAHVREETNTAGQSYLKSLQKGYEAIIVDAEWYRQTRLNLRKHTVNLVNVANFISGPAE